MLLYVFVVGNALAEAHINNIANVYTSPALRCVQTADAILKGMYITYALLQSQIHFKAMYTCGCNIMFRL